MSKPYHDLDLEGLNLSDSDDELFDAPVHVKKGKLQIGSYEKGDDAESSNKTRPTESRYVAEETRETQLRQELDNIRKINTVIEGVVESLEKANTNMEVRFPILAHEQWLIITDGQSNSYISINPPANMDADPLPNRTQPTPHTQPLMARRNRRSSQS